MPLTLHFFVSLPSSLLSSSVLCALSLFYRHFPFNKYFSPLKNSFLHMFLLPPNNSYTYNSSNIYIYIRTFLWKCILYVFLYKTKNSTRDRSNTFTIPLLCASPFNFLSNFSLRPITILGIRRIPQPRNSCHRLLALYLLFDRSVKRIFYKRPCSLSDVTIAHFQAGTRCDIVQYITLINNL